MNPLSPYKMSPTERRAELCRILALGLLRMKAQQSSELYASLGESSLHSLPDQRTHATPTQRRDA